MEHAPVEKIVDKNKGAPAARSTQKDFEVAQRPGSLRLIGEKKLTRVKSKGVNHGRAKTEKEGYTADPGEIKITRGANSRA